MTYEITTIPIKGTLTEKLPNTFFKQKSPSSHLGIVYPGMGYSCLGPILYYSTQLMIELGADVLNVNYNYQSLIEQSATERSSVIKQDGLAALHSALNQGQYKQLTLIGKSLGTRVLTFLLEDGQIQKQFPHLKIVWLTPIWEEKNHFQQMIDFEGSSLQVIGSNDPYFSEAKLDILKSRDNIKVLVFKDADHSLDVDGNINLSLSYLSQLISTMKDFV